MSDDSDFDLPDCDEDTNVNPVFVSSIQAFSPVEQTLNFEDPESPEDEELANDSLSAISIIKPRSHLHHKTASLTTDYSHVFTEFTKTFMQESFTSIKKTQDLHTIGVKPDFMGRSLKQVQGNGSRDRSQPVVRRSASNLDVQRRFYDYADKVKSKVERLRQDQLEVQSNQCPFKPAINEKAGTFADFLERSQKITKKVPQAIEKVVDQKPTINQLSAKLANTSKRDLTPVHLRLFEEARELIVKHKKAYVGRSTSAIISVRDRPSVSPMARDKSVHEDLYRDAKQRHLKQTVSDRLKEGHSPPSTLKRDNKRSKLMSENSAQLLKKKFSREVSQTLLAVGVQGDLADIKQTESLLSLMKYTSEPMTKQDSDLFLKVWILLEADLNVKVDRMSSFLKVLEGYAEVVEDINALAHEVRRTFRPMFEKRKLELLKKEISEEAPAPDFKEQTANSKDYSAKKKHESPPRSLHNMLHLEAKERNDRRAQLANEGLNTVLQSCTFKPYMSESSKQLLDSVEHKEGSMAHEYRTMRRSTSSITERLYNYAPKLKAYKEQKSTEAEAHRRSQSMIGCTFKTTNSKKVVNEKELLERLCKVKEPHHDSISLTSSMIVGIEYKSKYETIADRTKPLNIFKSIQKVASKTTVQVQPDDEVSDPDESQDVDSSFEEMSSISKASESRNVSLV